jgi:hypothetical protein
VSRQQQAAFNSISRTINTLREGERASEREVEAQRLVQRQTLGLRARMRP